MVAQPLPPLLSIQLMPTYPMVMAAQLIKMGSQKWGGEVSLITFTRRRSLYLCRLIRNNQRDTKELRGERDKREGRGMEEREWQQEEERDGAQRREGEGRGGRGQNKTGGDKRGQEVTRGRVGKCCCTYSSCISHSCWHNSSHGSSSNNLLLCMPLQQQ